MRKFIFIAAAMFFQQAAALVIPTNSMQEIADKILELPYSPEDILVAFDVDNVIIKSKDQVLNWNKYGKFIENNLNSIVLENNPNVTNEKEKKELYKGYISTIILQREPEIVEKKLFDVLSYLEENKIKSIALTMIDTGKFSKMGSIDEWRINELKGLGVDFSHSFTGINLENIDTQLEERFGAPKFKSGVLFAAGHDKGIILEKFLSHVKFKPKAIVFVDDKEKNILAVKEYCEKSGVDYLGFHYTFIENNDNKIELNEKRAKLQFSYLSKNDIWVGDEDIEKLSEF